MSQLQTRFSDDAENKLAIASAYAEIRKQNPWAHDKSPDILHHRVLPYATYSPWLSDQDFQRCYKQITNHTLVDIYRCYELWLLAKQLKDAPGSFLEVGVWRGGTGALLAAAGAGKTTYLADTFKGVVKAGENDTAYNGGEHADTSKTTVLSLLKEMHLSNAILLEGVFPDETSDRLQGPLALLHCDVDVYSSAKDVVAWAAPRLSVGGMMVFDDYGFSGCEGVTRFVNEFSLNKDFHFIHNLNGHAIFIKKV
jgi:O-methyltransferase